MHPAELAKLALVIYLAHWLARGGARRPASGRAWCPFLLISGRVIALVALEPDLGTTGVITLTAFTMFFVAGASILQLRLMVPVGIVAVGLYISREAVPDRPHRIFLDPWAERPVTASRPSRGCSRWPWAACSGRASARAASRAACRCPNADNDFMFAMVGQELGLVGAVVVIGLFLFLAWRGIRVALAAPDTFGALLALGITVLARRSRRSSTSGSSSACCPSRASRCRS